MGQYGILKLIQYYGLRVTPKGFASRKSNVHTHICSNKYFSEYAWETL